MGILNNIFKKKPKMNVQAAQGLDIYIPYFSGLYDPELNSTYVSICDAHAKHLSKIKPKVFLKDNLAESKKYLNRRLGLRFNPYMSATQGWEILAKDYFMVNNAIAFLEWDYTNYREPLKNIWPLDPDKNSMVVRQDGADVYIKFRLNGTEYVVGMDDILLITRNAKPSTLFGQGSKAVDTVLKVMQTNYEGIEQAIKTSAFIRFLIQSTTPLTEAVKKEKAKAFADAYLGTDATGIAYVDQAQTVTKVDSSATYANAAEQKIFQDEIYKYLGSNEKILKVEFTEDGWQAYYEGSLEPFILKLSDELNYKLLSKGELNAGNNIVIDANRLQTASMKTRIMIADRYMKLPLLVPNVVADLLYLPKSENGDKEYATLNWVQAQNQNQYQGVTEEDPGGDQPNDDQPPAVNEENEEE